MRPALWLTPALAWRAAAAPQDENVAEEASSHSTSRTQFALIIDGKALLYALSPAIKDLFLKVGGARAGMAAWSNGVQMMHA